MSCAPRETMLSLAVLQKECARLDGLQRRAMPFADLHQLLLDMVADATKQAEDAERRARSKDTPCTASEALCSAVQAVQIIRRTRFLLGELDTYYDAKAKRSAADSDKNVDRETAILQCLQSLFEWAQCCIRVPAYYASCIMVHLSALFSIAQSVSEKWSIKLDLNTPVAACILWLETQYSTEAAQVDQLLCHPLSMQVPWRVFMTAKTSAHVLERLCVFLEVPCAGSGPSGAEPGAEGAAAAAVAAAAATARSADVAVLFEKVQAYSTLYFQALTLYTGHLTREVFLNSYDTMDWKVGSAVPTVKSVAPFVWCVFLRCRDFAVRSLAQPAASRALEAPQMINAVGSDLIAMLLQRVAEDLRSLLTCRSADMHAERVAQVTTVDVPCLVLLTRLWWSHLKRSTTSVQHRLEEELVRLVNTAVELGHPLAVLESTVTRRRPSSEETAAADALDATESEATRTWRFLELVWGVTPLEAHEILDSASALPWSSTFPRAAAVKAVLDGHVVVATVE